VTLPSTPVEAHDITVTEIKKDCVYRKVYTPYKLANVMKDFSE
jgi:hypothetical protein